MEATEDRLCLIAMACRQIFNAVIGSPGGQFKIGERLNALIETSVAQYDERTLRYLGGKRLAG